MEAKMEINKIKSIMSQIQKGEMHMGQTNTRETKMKISKINKGATLLNLFEARQGFLIDGEVFVEENGQTVFFTKESTFNDLKDEAEQILEMNFEGIEKVQTPLNIIEHGTTIYECEEMEVIPEAQEQDSQEEETPVTEEEVPVTKEERKEEVQVIELFSPEDFDEGEEEAPSEVSNETVESEVVEEVVEAMEEDLKPAETAKPTNTKVGDAKVYPKYFGEDKDEEVREFLESNGVSENFVKWAMNVRRENRERVKGYPQRIIDEIPESIDYFATDDKLSSVLIDILQDAPLAHSGSTGVGKTMLVRVLSAALNYPLFTIEGNESTDQGDFLGEYDIKEKGVLSVNDGQMVLAAEYGGILLIDEINMIDADVLAFVNAFTDDRKQFYSSLRGKTIRLHKMTRFTCTLNEGEGYFGTKELNKATRDRLTTQIYDYPTKREVKDIIDHYAERYKNDYVGQVSFIEKERIASLYGLLTMAVRNDILPEEVGSVRTIQKLVRDVPAHGFAKALERVIDNYSSEEIRGAIVGVLQKDGFTDEIGFDTLKYLSE